jgi:hypothetical protein
MTRAKPASIVLSIALFGFVVLFSPAVRADEQSDRIKALEKRLEESLRLIRQLSNRISDLERTVAPSSPAASAVAGAPPRPPEVDRGLPSMASLQEEVDQINEGLAQRKFDSGLPVHGFADVAAATTSSQAVPRLRGFNGGTLDLYLTPQFGDRVRSLVEIAFEFDPHERGTSADMERLQLGYTVSDSLTLWMGRFHTPFGLWNTSFHHGANLQTSIYRPRFIEFEDRGGIIPAHTVGIWGTGKTQFGPGKVTYDVYVGNGPSIRDRELDFNPFTDDSSSKVVGFNLGYQPSGALRGWSAGVHGFGTSAGQYSPSDVLLARTRVRMGGAYIGYDANDWEVFGEYYHFADRNDGETRRRSSDAGFLHVGRSFGSLTPFVRYERASLDPADDYFAAQITGRSYTRFVLGARYALDARSSIKLELQRTDEAGVEQRSESGGLMVTRRARYGTAAFQYSLAF